MSRGDRRETIVCEDGDRELWIRTLGEACAKCGPQFIDVRLESRFQRSFIIRRIIPGVMSQAFA
jgi:hypothetical protein